MRACIVRIAMTLGLLAAWVASASAHPDIAASARLSFEMQGQRLLAMSELLVFDAATSGRVAARFDVDGDGSLSPTERETLLGELFARLEDRGFFAEVSLAGKRLQLPTPAVIDWRFEGSYLQLRLAFRFTTPPDLANRTLDVLVRDRDLIIAFNLDPAAPVIAGGEANGCTTVVEKRQGEAYFGGLVTPSVVTLTCR